MKNWLKKLIAKLIESLKKKTDTPKPEPKPDKPEPTASEDEAANGFSHPAQIVAKLFNGRWNKSGVYFSCTERGWTDDKEACDGEAWLGVKRNGKWVIGKFDKIRRSSTSRDWKNLNPSEPYGAWIGYGVPVAGEPVCLFVLNFARNQRTNAIFGVYP